MSGHPAPRWANQHTGKTVCHKGHPLSGDNLRPSADGHRRCRQCSADWNRVKRQRMLAQRVACPSLKQLRGTVAMRKNEPGLMLARGPLDYDVPVARRCENCGCVSETTLANLHGACVHCGRYAGAA